MPLDCAENSTILGLVLASEMVCQYCARLIPFSIEERHKMAGETWSAAIGCKRCGGASYMYDMLGLGLELLCCEALKSEHYGYKGKRSRLKRAHERIHSEWGQQRMVKRMLRLRQLREAQGLLALLSRLTKSEKACFLANGYFDVRGSDRQKYRIYFSTHSNIAVVDGEGVPLRGWCYHAGEFMSVGDNMLTQKLYIENDAPGFFATANPQREDWMDGVGSFSDWKRAIRKYLKLAKRQKLSSQTCVSVNDLPASVLAMDLDCLAAAPRAAGAEGTTAEAAAASETTEAAAETTTAEAAATESAVATAEAGGVHDGGNLRGRGKRRLAREKQHDEGGVGVSNLDSAHDLAVALG